MSESRQKTVLITGATKGIGYELAKLFARDSYNLVLVARNTNLLREVKKELNDDHPEIDIAIISIDLSKPGAAPEVFRNTEEKGLAVDVLVNNAGIGDFGKFYREDYSRISSLLHINIIALTELTRLYLEPMVRRGDGKILNVSSVAGFMPGPYMAIYYASKAYVLSFSEAISSELAGTGVTVTTSCPGPTKTGFQQEVGSESSFLARFHLLASAKEVAEDAYKALQKGRKIEIPGIFNLTLVGTSKILTDKIKARIVKRLQEINRSDDLKDNE